MQHAKLGTHVILLNVKDYEMKLNICPNCQLVVLLKVETMFQNCEVASPSTSCKRSVMLRYHWQRVWIAKNRDKQIHLKEFL